MKRSAGRRRRKEKVQELSQKLHLALVLLACALACPRVASAATPKLNIRTAHGDQGEMQRMAQMERLAGQYDLTKYTLTRDIMIERGAMNHSAPVLTLNLRFLDNDDLALSAYVHEQGHWVLMERHRMDMQPLFLDLQRAFPNIDYRQPHGDGSPRGTYYHVAVCMLEWQAMEDLVGPERARKVIEWKHGDHYTDVYQTILGRRDQVESIMKRYAIRW